MLGCARPAPLDPARVDVCTLATRGAELDGQRVSLRAIANFAHIHGAFLTDNACRDEIIDLDATREASRSPYFAEGEQNLDAFRDAVLDVSGVFHYGQRRLFVDEFRSRTFVRSRLGVGCERTGRSREFCDCLEDKLGPQAKPEYQDALVAIMADIPSDLMMSLLESPSRSSEFRSIVADAPYDSGATRAAFTQCAARASR